MLNLAKSATADFSYFSKQTNKMDLEEWEMKAKFQMTGIEIVLNVNEKKRYEQRYYLSPLLVEFFWHFERFFFWIWYDLMVIHGDDKFINEIRISKYRENRSIWSQNHVKNIENVENHYKNTKLNTIAEILIFIGKQKMINSVKMCKKSL